MFKRNSITMMTAFCGVAGALTPAIATPTAQTKPLRDWLSRPIAMRSVSPNGTGYLPTDDATFDGSPRINIVAATRGLPRQVMLTDFLPPVGSQGAQQSCVAWSAAYYVYSYTVAQERHFEPSRVQQAMWEFSPSYVYNQAKQPGGGMNLKQALAVLHDQGCATMAEMPYNPKDDSAIPSDQAKARARKFRNATPAYVFRYLEADSQAIKTYLSERRQPFTTAIPLFSDFPQGPVAKDFVYNLTVDPTRKNLRGGHAVTVVGYDDAKQAFRIVNSWGTGWGDKGFLWISQDFIQKYALEGWTETPGGPGVRAFLRSPVRLSDHVTLEMPATSGGQNR